MRNRATRKRVRGNGHKRDTNSRGYVLHIFNGREKKDAEAYERPSLLPHYCTYVKERTKAIILKSIE